MSRRARITLVIALFLAFFLTAPVLLLYTSGYSYSVKKQRIEKTGSLTVESFPRGAEVRINGVPEDQNTPLTVSRLLPETYEVEILSKGYIPWKKRLLVESGKTTFAKAIALLPDALPHLAVSIPSPSLSVWSSDGTKVAYTMRDDAGLEMLIHDTESASTTLVDRFPSDAYVDTLFSWSPDSRTVAVALRSRNDVALYLYDAEGERQALAAHDTLTDLTFAAPAWTDDGRAVFLAAEGAYAADAALGTLSPLIVASGLSDIAVHGDTVWTVRIDHAEKAFLERRIVDGVETESVLTLERPYTFVRITDTTVLLADERTGSGLFVDAATGKGRTMSEYTASAASPADDRTLLLCGRFELATFVPGTDETPNVLTRLSEPIDSCAWHPSGQYAFYSTDGRVIAIELDERDGRNSYLIADFKDANTLSIDPNAAMLRFMGEVGSQRGLFDRPL